MKTKHKILSVLAIMAILAGLWVVVAAPASAGTVSAVSVVETPATASSVAGYQIGFTTATVLNAGQTVVVTFPAEVTLPTSISKSLVTLTGVTFQSTDADPLVSGQQLVVTIPTSLVAGLPQSLAAAANTLTISQAAGIKNPAIAKTIASQAYPLTVVTTADQTIGTGYVGVVPSYAISVNTGVRSTPVTVTGKGWSPNSSIIISEALTNSVTGGSTLADGTFTVTAYPFSSGVVSVTDGAGQTELYQAGSRAIPAFGIPLVVTSAWDYAVTAANFTISATVSVSPTSGNVGSTITINGFDFTSGSKIHAITVGGAVPATITPALDVALSTIDAYGTLDDFTLTVKIPASQTGGSKSVVVTDLALKTASGTFSVNAPALSVNPGSGQPNTTVTISGSKFAAGDTIGITGAPGTGGLWWGTPFTAGAFVMNDPASAVGGSGPITVDASGNWTVTLKIPAGAAIGTNPIVAMSAGGTVASWGFIVGARAATLTPATGPIGTNVVVTAANMTKGGTVDATSNPAAPATDYPKGIQFANNNWVPVAGTAFPITIDSLGNMKPTTLLVPGASTGAQTVSVTDNGGIVAVGVFTVTQPTIAISPATGNASSTVTVTGSGWVPGLTGLVTIQFNGTSVVLATPDSTGAFTAAFNVPVSTTATNVISAFDGMTTGGVATPNRAPVQTFTLGIAAVSISPTSGGVGTQVTMTGTGFTPYVGLQSLTVGGVSVIPSTPVLTDPTGAFSATFVVPGLATGAQTVSVNVGGVSVNTFFTITTGAVNVQTQLASISSQLVIVWGLTSGGEWQFMDPTDTVGSNLTVLLPGSGYFIKVNNACTLTYGGFVYNLVSGWNLIGWR